MSKMKGTVRQKNRMLKKINKYLVERPFMSHLKECLDKEIKEIFSAQYAFSLALALSLMNDSCNYATLFKGRTGCHCLVEDKIWQTHA